ncbi:putative ribonuclease H-like domain-containing protein [Tanacetum coccineum]
MQAIALTVLANPLGHVPTSLSIEVSPLIMPNSRVEVTKLTTGRLVNGSSCDGIDMIEILHDVVGTSGYHCGVLRSFPMERIEQGIGWMFDIDYLTDSMNYIPVSLENQANPHADASEVTNSAGTSQTPNANASEENDEDAELIVVPSAVKNTEEKVETRKSSTHSKKEEILTEPQQEKEASSTDTSEDNPKILAFRRELEEIALKHLGTVSENNSTNTPSVNSGSEPVNTGKLDPDDSPMPELEIFHKSETGIFDEASYDEEGVITDFNSLPTEIEVSPTPTLRIHNIHPKSQILGDPKSAVQTRSKVQQKSGAHALLSYIQKQQRNNHKDQQHCLFACFLSQEEPKKISEALQDDSWVQAMQEELLQFKLQQVWVLVDLPHGMKVIGTKWVYINKRDERGVVIRNEGNSDDEASNHEDASDTGAAPKQQQQVIPQTTAISNIKLPILKKEEYDIWAMEMEHYLEYIDNDVWKVIQNGNSKKRISTGKDGIVRILSPVTAAEIQAIWEAIRTRFGGNANSKKMQKAVFKQQFEAFKISSSEGGLDLLHEDLEQIDNLDIEEMDINWQIAMIAIRMKKFYKKTGRRVRVDGKTPVGFDKKKLECFNCHNTGHFARECTAKGTHDGKKKRDSFYQQQEAGKQEKNQMGADKWMDGFQFGRSILDVEETNHALMAISSSNEVSLCSKTCIDSYNTLKTLCDEQMNQLGDQEAQILAYSQAVKKLEAQLEYIGTSSEHSVDPESKISSVPQKLQLNAGKPNINSVRPNINTGRTNVNPVRTKVNTGSSNVNTVRTRQPVPNKTSNCFSPKRPQMNQFNQRGHFSKSYSSVRRPFTKTIAQMFHSHAIKGNWGSAVKTSTCHNWRNSKSNSNCDSGPTFIRTVIAKGPQGRPKPEKAWGNMTRKQGSTGGILKEFNGGSVLPLEVAKATIYLVGCLEVTNVRGLKKKLYKGNLPQIQERGDLDSETSTRKGKAFFFLLTLLEDYPNTPTVNTGSEQLNTGCFVLMDSPMPELEIFYTNLPHGMKVIGTKWVYRNKRDERGVVVRNKARLVAQGYTLGEVYVSQPPGFVDPAHLRKVTRDKKDIMLVQVYVDDIIFGSTKKYWCDEFEALMKSIFQMSSIGELTFFLGLQVKQNKEGIFISQDKYVAEILKKFHLVNVKTAITPMETKVALTKDEEAVDVDVHLYRSMIVTPKTSHLNAVKRIFKYLKGKPHLGLWYPRESPFDLEAFSDSDYGGSNLDRKSTTGIAWICRCKAGVIRSFKEKTKVITDLKLKEEKDIDKNDFNGKPVKVFE